VDAVTIMDANFDAATGILSITAMSSDMLGAPMLSAVGIPGGSATGSDELTAGSLTLTLPAGTVPPKAVMIVSTAGGSATATVTMPSHSTPYLTGAPLAVDDFVSTGESAAVTNFAILANDGAEAVASSLTLLAGSGPTNGTATALLDGTVNYTPNAGFFGTDSFQYTVSSAAPILSSNVATVTIDVVQINDAPVANNDLAAAPGLATTITVNVVANDTDLDGIAPAPGGLDPTTVAVVAVTGASAISNPDGTVSYTKDAICEAAANCSFTYTVSDNGGLTSNIATVTVETAGNLAPIANADAASTLEGVTVNIDVAGNDSDVDGLLDFGSVVISSAPANGNAAPQPNGSVDYTPNAGFTGIETFSYTINDMLGATSSPAVVTVTVNPNPDTILVQRAQCRAGKNEWRVDGTSSILTPHSVTVYAGATVGGTVLVSNIPVDNLGAWRMSKNNTSAGCVSTISIESSLGGKLENVAVGN